MKITTLCSSYPASPIKSIFTSLASRFSKLADLCILWPVLPAMQGEEYWIAWSNMLIGNNSAREINLARLTTKKEHAGVWFVNTPKTFCDAGPVLLWNGIHKVAPAWRNHGVEGQWARWLATYDRGKFNNVMWFLSFLLITAERGVTENDYLGHVISISSSIIPGVIYAQ